MTGPRDITQLCFSSNLAVVVANKIGQIFYSVYSYSGIESIEHTVSVVEGAKFKFHKNITCNAIIRQRKNYFGRVLKKLLR